MVTIVNKTDKSNMYNIESEQYIEEPWSIIESYFKGHHLERLVRHQLESYNNFVGYQINKTIEMFNPVHIVSDNDYDPASKKHSLEVFITFENFQMYRPQIHENNGAIKLMFPQEARLRNFTYASAMTIDINIKYIIRTGANLENSQTICKTLSKIHIGKLPIMLKSNICVLNQYKYVEHTHTGECKYDAGGYFIINGSEKTVLGQERTAENRVYCFNVSKNNTKYSWSAEIKSVPDTKCISPKQTNVMISSKNNGFGNAIYVQIPRIKQVIPLFIVFRALGIITDKEICEKILLDINYSEHKLLLQSLQASIIDANIYLTQEESIKYITSFAMYTPINMDKETGIKKKLEFTMDILKNDLFPHCQNITQKIYFLGYMTNKLLHAKFELIKPDDRDSYINKRIDLTGTLLNNLFRNYFNKLVKDMEKQVIREINTGSWKSSDDYENIINLTNLYKIIKSTTIENGLKRALATGDFGIKHINSNKVGVAQVLNRLTYISSLSHARRVSTPTDKSGKLIPPRKLHNTCWGYLCPAETPEGQSVGIVKNLSYMTHVTIHSNSQPLYEYITPYVIKLENQELTSLEMFNKVKVFINGAWLGVTNNPYELFISLKEKKYKGIINIYTSIIFDYRMKEIRICNDSGRLTRPVLRVKDKNILLDNDIISKISSGELIWDNLLTSTSLPESVIEYIDPEEQSLSLIATKPKDIINYSPEQILKYTHCEIHPSTIFGILASCIPFPENNQSPRNTYQCLDINELVLLSSGEKRRIADINIGDEVISFHPETMETSFTKVTHHYIRETIKKIYNIKTISGREIIATEDHKFMTSSGWIEVKDLIPTITKIGIYMNNCYPINNNSFGELSCILSEEQFINFFKEQNFKMKLIMKYVSELKNQELLPLYNNNNKISILSRIFGFILSDGSINCYTRDNNKFTSCSLDFGTIKDYTDFQNDIKYCGFRNCAYYAGSRTFNNRTHQTFSVSHNGSLPALLLSLGITFGRKTETIRNPIPDWIMTGSLIIKREFLAGFQGGDGCKIRWNKLNKKGYNYVCASTTQQINPIYQQGLSNFINQCIQLMTEFNIIVNYIEEPVVENRIKIGYKMSDSQDNLINYYDNIGYRYSYTKNSSSAKVIEYLKYKKTIFEKHTSLILNIRKLYDESKTNTHISNVLNVPCNFISDTLRSYKNNRQISCPNLKENNIEQWLNEMVSVNETMFITIDSITEVENRLISDITVESENHSFIAGNNFLSSNCAQGKQAMGVYATNYETRMDKTAYVLNYPARPLVDTRLMNLIQLNKIPSGTNVIVAIMTHTGYNQEDSILFNKGSIDRGLFVTTIYHTEKDEDKQKINGDEEIRCKPDISKTKGIKMGNYNKVNNKGVIPENTIVENRDIIIAKVTPIKENRNDHTKIVKFEDHSKIFKTTEETFIDKNYIDRNGEGYNFAKVRLRTFRKPVIGDKFSSRHGQKGTIGNIIPECDMPFTKNGLKPDIIINPHAIPSRMTIGQLKETILGKVLLELGLFGDGTPFGQLSVKDMCDELLKLGYESNGNELLCNGLTGEQHECSVFMGPVFYQRLKHMVNDKTHSRSIGPMVNLTRQPAEGRSRDGGLRFGEMERDCFKGASHISINNGLSIKIETMEKYNWDVMGWSEKHNGIVKATQTDFMYKGERYCVSVTLEDGHKIICTEDHPILTSENEWVKVKDLLINRETRVKCGINYPLMEIEEEINECDGWNLDLDIIKLQTQTPKHYLRTLAFARIIGYLIADGSISYDKRNNVARGVIYLGHMLDVNSLLIDLRMFCHIRQTKFKINNYYYISIPQPFMKIILKLKGIIIGRKITQPAELPEFILDDKCPRPIIREFLGGLFGADGHTCSLLLHRGKRDNITSISFSQSKTFEHLGSLTTMIENIKHLLNKCGIHKITIQNFKETTSSKKKNIKLGENKTDGNHQLTLHLDMDELIPFYEKIGFRYCCHKSQRLEGGVSYKRLRNEVTRQHNWLVNRVDEITKFTEIKRINPNKIVHTKKAIIQAVDELKTREGLLHEYAIPSTHDITDHLIKGTTFGKFTSKSFPTAEQYLESIGALSWFLKDESKPYYENNKGIIFDNEYDENLDETPNENNVNIEDIEETEEITTDEEENSKYGVNRSKLCLPTMNLKVISILPAGVHKVYDISVDKVHSFLADGVVAHNCMVSHGAARFTRGRLYDASDKYSVHVCKKCGLIASYNNELNIHLCKTCDNRTDFAYVEIPYSCKLLFQELITMNVAPRIITEH